MFMVLQSWKSQNLVSFNDNDDCEDDIDEYNDEKDDIVDSFHTDKYDADKTNNTVKSYFLKYYLLQGICMCILNIPILQT